MLVKHRHLPGMRIHRHLCVLFLTLYAVAAHSSDVTDQWELCKARPQSPVPVAEPWETGTAGAIVLTADKAEVLNRETVHLDGDVHATLDGQHLRADSATYHKTSDQLHAEGSIRYYRNALGIYGNSARMELGSNTGRLNNASYDLYTRHARGNARSAELESEHMTVLRQVSYTTCDVNDEAWLLKSGTVRLNHSEGVGSAKNVYLSFKHVPFFYFPYLTFPIDDRRKSGFLTPSYGHSSDSGSEVILPYYLNIAPQADATLAPRVISKRGTMLNGEFRYLTPVNKGQLDIEYLSDDDLTGEDRNLIQFRDIARFSRRLSSAIEISHASDGEYFRDLGNSLSLSSITHLRQLAALDYQGDTWSTMARMESFQTIDEAIPRSRRPYQRLPQLLFQTHRPAWDGHANYKFTGEYVDFRHDDRISGSRIDLQPGIEFPLRSHGWFLVPAATLRHTAYSLDDDATAAGSHPARTLPLFSLDSGIFLERDSQWGSQAMIHALEPRLYYLYVPLREQSDIPLFDSGMPDFNFTRLFLGNRFTGSDRIGDADQLSFSLTTRFFERDTGRERLRASIGRILYFQDREVTLSNQPETEDFSDVVAEVVATPIPQLSAKLDLRWDQETRQIDKGSVHLQYRLAKHGIFNAAYRYREPTLRQSDFSILWPLGRRWNVIGRRNYSLLDHRALETLAGLEYQSCCWRIHAVKRRYVNDDLGETRENFYIQLELKGLTSIGNSLDSVLEHGILGYQN